MSVSMEKIYRVYDDNMGFFIQVAPDPDGLGMMEISYWENGSDKVAHVNVGSDMFELFLSAVGNFINESEG